MPPPSSPSLMGIIFGHTTAPSPTFFCVHRKRECMRRRQRLISGWRLLPGGHDFIVVLEASTIEYETAAVFHIPSRDEDVEWLSLGIARARKNSHQWTRKKGEAGVRRGGPPLHGGDSEWGIVVREVSLEWKRDIGMNTCLIAT